MKKKIKTLCLALCGAVALGLGTLATINIQNANAETELIVPQEFVLGKEYNFGDKLNVPSPASVRIKAGGMETAAVSVVLRFPDGTAKSEGVYTLDRTGNYELTYYNANGVSATQKFTVYKNAYGIDEGASANYVTDLVGVAGKEGIAVTLRDGSAFTFNHTINLNDFAGETLEVCKVFPMYRESSNDNPTAHTLAIRLVDYYDASKFVEYYIWCGEGSQAVYMGAGASTQNFTGLEQNRHRPHEMTEEYNGELYKIHRPQRYQSKTTWGTGMSFMNNSAMIETDGITVMWDLSNQQVKARSRNIVLITDLDSPEIYGVNTLDFDSFFTTGEVYLEMEAYNYTTGSFEFGIEEIFGIKGDALKDARLIDKTSPELSVDVEPTEGNRIYLQKGAPVTLPAITHVFDHNYYGQTRVEVYHNYGKQGQALLNVENGVFVPQALGNYTVVYTAVDAYGNEGKFFLEMVVLDEENLVYQPNALSKLVAAKANVLPYIDARGINKPVEVEVSILTPNGEQIILDDNGEDGYTYIPAYAGEYTINYLFKDNVYKEVYSYSVTCVDEKAATFQKAFALPSYFMKGASYTIAPVVAYTAGDGKFNENKATMSVSVDGGAYQTLTDAQMKEYKVEANQSLRFKATYEGNFIESAVYPVVDVGYGKKISEKNYLNYWQGDYAAAEMSLNGASYAFNGDGKLQFVNLVSSKGFNMNFSVTASKAESVSFTLRDARDPYKTYVTYTYIQPASSNVTMNAKQYEDGKLVLDKTIPTKMKGLNTKYTLSYSVAGMKSGEVVLEGVKAFEEDRALLEISVCGAAEGCTITTSQLNYQTFSTSMRESLPQMSYVEGNGVQERNAIYEIAPCFASSAFSSVLSKDVKVTVLAPDGKVAQSVDKIALEGVPADRVYQLKLTQIGQYRVTYEASCLVSTRNGQDSLQDSNYYIINVSEGVAPTLKFKDGSNEQTTVYLELGSTHKVKAYSVSDNVSKKENIKVYTMILGKDFALEENGYDVTSYTFKNKGEFIVYVVAYDELGNSSYIYYNVVVS